MSDSVNQPSDSSETNPPDKVPLYQPIRVPQNTPAEAYALRKKLAAEFHLIDKDVLDWLAEGPPMPQLNERGRRVRAEELAREKAEEEEERKFRAQLKPWELAELEAMDRKYLEAEAREAEAHRLKVQAWERAQWEEAERRDREILEAGGPGA